MLIFTLASFNSSSDPSLLILSCNRTLSEAEKMTNRARKASSAARLRCLAVAGFEVFDSLCRYFLLQDNTESISVRFKGWEKRKYVVSRWMRDILAGKEPFGILRVASSTQDRPVNNFVSTRSVLLPFSLEAFNANLNI